VIIGTREMVRGEDYLTGSFNFCTHHRTLFEGFNKKILAGRAYNYFRVEESLWWETCGCHHVQNQGIYVNIILK
jgi:hypothetical protein